MGAKAPTQALLFVHDLPHGKLACATTLAQEFHALEVRHPLPGGPKTNKLVKNDYKIFINIEFENFPANNFLKIS